MPRHLQFPSNSLAAGTVVGYVLGYVLGLVALTVEDVMHGATFLSSLSDVHHHLNALFIGALAAFPGLWISLLLRRNRAGDRKVAEQRDFLQTLIETVPIPIFYKDRAGHYLGCNPTFEAFLGRRQAELIGKGVYELGPEELAEKYQAKDRELFDRPGTQVYDWLVKTPSGLREVLFHKATFLDGEGRVAGLVGAVLDVTEKRRAQALLDREAQRRGQLFGAMGHLAELTVSRGGEIISMTPGLSHLLDCQEPASLVGRSAAVLFRQPRDLEAILQMEKADAEGEYRTLAFNGKDRTIRAGVFIVPDEAQVHMIISPLTGDAMLIPICASCRLIRDSDGRGGAWISPADFFTTHQDEIKHPTRPFAFSHSICPDCVPIIYPELNRR